MRRTQKVKSGQRMNRVVITLKSVQRTCARFFSLTRHIVWSGISRSA